MPCFETIARFVEPHHSAIIDVARGFCQAIGDADYRDDAAARAAAPTLVRQMADHGLLTAVAQRDLRACGLIREVLAGHSPLADALFALQALGTMPIALYGTAQQRQRYVDPVVAGQKIAAFGMTETGAGSDVRAIQTHAEPVPDGFRINGAKTLISNAGIAHFYCVFAKTGDALSCFVVDADTPGLCYTGALVMSEPHPLGQIEFRDCVVPQDALVGTLGKGINIGMASLDCLRGTVGAAACGMAGRALSEASMHVIKRKQFGKELADFQLVQQKIARSKIGLTAARLLVYRALHLIDSGQPRVTEEAAMAKAFATECAQSVVDDAIQLVGGRAVMADHILDRLYRSVRALRIYEGTTEIQHLIIAGLHLKAVRRQHRDR